jgi:hypothetical protein
MTTNDHSEAIRTITGHAREVTRGSYEHTEELQRLADESVYSPEIAGLAEAFGMMSIKVEAREFALQQKNAELKPVVMIPVFLLFFVFALLWWFESPVAFWWGIGMVGLGFWYSLVHPFFSKK